MAAETQHNLSLQLSTLLQSQVQHLSLPARLQGRRAIRSMSRPEWRTSTMSSWTTCARWAVLRKQQVHVHEVLAVGCVQGSLLWGLSYIL